MADKPMRALMPETAALVDAFRARGLTDNAALSQGMKAGTFWAREGGQQIGTPAPPQRGVRAVLPLNIEQKHLDREWRTGTWRPDPHEARVREMNRQWMERGRKSMEGDA